MIVKDHISGKFVMIQNKDNHDVYFQDIVRTKYNINIQIPKQNQVQLIQNNLRVLYEKRKSKTSIFWLKKQYFAYIMGKTRKKTKSVFREEDFKSGDGMLTTVWGPSLWHSLHTISFNYPLHPTKQDKIQYRRFIHQLKYVLPCKYCRLNLKENFKCLPLKHKHMKNRDTFSRYVYVLHELINKMLKKKW